MTKILYRETNLFWNFILPATFFLCLIVLVLRSDMPALLVTASTIMLIFFLSIICYTYFRFRYIFKIEDNSIYFNSLFRTEKVQTDLIENFTIRKSKAGRIFDTKHIIVELKSKQTLKYYFFDFNAQEAIDLLAEENALK